MAPQDEEKKKKKKKKKKTNAPISLHVLDYSNLASFQKRQVCDIRKCVTYAS